MTTIADMRLLYPQIAWHEPIRVVVPGREAKYVCRICIAELGLKASDLDHVSFAFDERDTAVGHINGVHDIRR